MDPSSPHQLKEKRRQNQTPSGSAHGHAHGSLDSGPVHLNNYAISLNFIEIDYKINLFTFWQTIKAGLIPVDKKITHILTDFKNATLG